MWNLQIQRTDCKTLEHLQILVSTGVGSWNQSPSDTKGHCRYYDISLYMHLIIYIILIITVVLSIYLSIYLSIIDLKQIDSYFFSSTWVYSGSAKNCNLGSASMVSHV